MAARSLAAHNSQLRPLLFVCCQACNCARQSRLDSAQLGSLAALSSQRTLASLLYGQRATARHIGALSLASRRARPTVPRARLFESCRDPVRAPTKPHTKSWPRFGSRSIRVDPSGSSGALLLQTCRVGDCSQSRHLNRFGFAEVRRVPFEKRPQTRIRLDSTLTYKQTNTHTQFYLPKFIYSVKITISWSPLINRRLAVACWIRSVRRFRFRFRLGSARSKRGHTDGWMPATSSHRWRAPQSAATCEFWYCWKTAWAPYR